MSYVTETPWWDPCSAQHVCDVFAGWGRGGGSSRVTRLRKAEAAMKRQEQRPDCLFAPGQMVADAEPPGLIALDQAEQGPGKRDM